MKTVCIYHKNCFDGICASWVVKKKYPNAEFIAINYGDDNLLQNFQQDCYENANINDDYIIVDFSLPRDLMIQMWNKCKSFVVLDHHKTAQKDCEGLGFCLFDMNESGASLAWKYFHGGELPLLVRYVKDRDLWLWKEMDSRPVNSYIQSFPLTIESMEKLHYEFTFNGESINNIVNAGNAIERYKASRVDDICATAELQLIKDYKVPVVNTSVLFSEVPEKLLELYPDSKFAVYYYEKLSDGIRQWGARSRNDFDVSEIAKKFGGGGHRNASGWQEKL